MKVDSGSVLEVMLGVLLGGAVLIVIWGLFGGWLQSQGEKITNIETLPTQK